MAEYSEVNQRSATRVAVVGMGIVSPLGIGITETATALREGRDCISPVNRFPVDHCRCKTAGQISDARLTCPQTLPLRQERLHRVARMTILALGEALASAPDFQPELSVVGTTSGGMTYGEEYYRGLKGKKISKRKAPSLIANYTPQKPIMDAQQAFGFSAPCQVIANACASGTNAIGHAFDCIRSGRYNQILTGAMMLFRNWFSWDSIPFKHPPQKDVGRLIKIELVWCWAKGQRFSCSKISIPRKHEERRSWQRWLGTVFRPTTITSPNQIRPEADLFRRWKAP